MCAEFFLRDFYIILLLKESVFIAVVSTLYCVHLTLCLIVSSLPSQIEVGMLSISCIDGLLVC